MKAQKAWIKKAAAAAIQTGLLYFIAYGGNGLTFWQERRTIADAVGRSGVEASVGITYTVIFILVDGEGLSKSLSILFANFFKASLVLSQVAPFLHNFNSAAAAFLKLEKDMKHISALDGNSETDGRRLDAVFGGLEFKNVSFTYPSHPEHPVINDLSLICPAGKHTRWAYWQWEIHDCVSDSKTVRSPREQRVVRWT